MFSNSHVKLKNILNSPSECLIQRHRLTIAQLKLLGNDDVDKKMLLVEKALALSHVQKTREVLEDLLSVEQDFILLKGVELSHRLYGDPSLRFSKDIDILIWDKDKISGLVNDLIKIGWSLKEENWISEGPRQKWLLNLTSDISMKHPNGALVEIHWNLDPFLFNLNDSKTKSILLKNISQFYFYNRRIKVLSPELELIYLIIHGSRHAWFRLKWLVDILHFPLDKLDLLKFKKLQNELGICHLFPHVKDLIFDIFKENWNVETQNVNDFLYRSSMRQILNEEPNSTPNFREFLNLLIHNSYLIRKPAGILKMLVRIIGVRPNDIKEVNFRFYWMYFFYRYISLIRRKFMTLTR